VATSPRATDLDIEGIRWRKSSFSGGNNNCVELGAIGDYIAIRDSKHPEQRPLVHTRAEIAAFLARVTTLTDSAAAS
jgi:hypothetical protein